MPSKPIAGAKKKLVKALSLKEVAVKEAQKAATVKAATRGKENLSSVTAGPALTSVRHTRTGDTVSMPATVGADLGVTSTATDIAASREEIQQVEIRILQAQLASMRDELRAAKEAGAGGSNREPAPEKRPKNITNLQAAMSLMNDDHTYHAFGIDIKICAVAAGLDYNTHWCHQDVEKIARVCNMVKKKHPFLKRYACDWPTKEYLKRHFNNQRNYNTRRAKAKKTKCKGKGKAMESSDDMWDFGSDKDGGDDEQEEF